jgi:hypothetical protein
MIVPRVESRMASHFTNFAVSFLRKRMKIRLPFVGESCITEAKYRYVNGMVLTTVTLKNYSILGCDVM